MSYKPSKAHLHYPWCTPEILAPWGTPALRVSLHYQWRNFIHLSFIKSYSRVLQVCLTGTAYTLYWVSLVDSNVEVCQFQTLTSDCSIFNYPSNFEGLLLTLHERYILMAFFLVFLKTYIFISGENFKTGTKRNRNCFNPILCAPGSFFAAVQKRWR